MPKTMPNALRYALVMGLGLLMNRFLSMLIRPLNLPFELDMSGTVLVALVLEPTAGILVGYGNNFIASLQSHDPSAVIYFAISAAVALVVGVLLKDKEKLNLRRLGLTMAASVLTISVLSTLITIWRIGGRSDFYWEAKFYDMASGLGAPMVLSCFFGAFMMAIGTVLATTCVVALVYCLLPKCLRLAPPREPLASPQPPQ